jgi:hypothetical protein
MDITMHVSGSYRGVLVRSLFLAVGGAVAVASMLAVAPTPPPYAPDAYEPPASAPSQSPVLVALSRGDLQAATQAVLEPREAVVQLRDGQRFSGILVERTPERVVLKIAGIDTPIRDELIDRVMVLPPVRERYLAMRAALEPEDIRGILLLVEWLRAREQWDLALYEVDQVLTTFPNDPEARRLRLLIISQRNLADRARQRAEEAAREQPGRNAGGEGEGSEAGLPPAPAGGLRPRTAPPAPVDDGDFPLLTDAQINLIKVYELDLSSPPRLLIDRSTITRLITEYGEDPQMPRTREDQAMLYRASPARVLDLMFRVRARNLYSEVKVLDQPRSMRLFRDEVHRSWIINSCATTRCHGGSEAGRLRLYNRRPGSDQTVYTNFLILERFRLADGTPLINYDDPARSPLLHMGLPRAGSRYPHPPVPAADGRADLWRPTFRNAVDRRFIEATEWINSMYRPRPEYPIEYTPPTSSELAPSGPIER